LPPALKLKITKISTNVPRISLHRFNGAFRIAGPVL
jgi:hypothetical protein